MRGLLSIDRWIEVIELHRRNPLRTGLTAFSVAWGVFMLILLLAFGDGLENSLRWSFRDDAINSIWIWPGRATVPYQGLPINRSVQLTDDDTELIRSLPESEAVTARFIPSGQTISYQGRAGDFDIRATHPDHQILEGTLMLSGRFLNPRDLEERRKVAVIGLRVAEFLFPGRDPVQAPLGERIRVGGLAFRVVGVFEDVGGEREMQKVYLPITTAQAAFGGRDRVNMVMFTVGPPDIDAASLDLAEQAVNGVRTGLSGLHLVSPDDRGALRIRDNLSRYSDVQAVFVWLRGFTWVVGLGTVFAGIVAVGNILLISVKERTAELGLRKALGARPVDLMVMVVQEALVLTTLAGWAGLVAGIGVLELARRFLPENETLRDPNVDLGSVLLATAALVIAGTLAGLVPARRAATIPPVEALRSSG